MCFFRHWAPVVFLCAGFAAGGCDSGPPVAEVSGTVSYDGKPIEKGNIAFFPDGGKGQPAGGLIENGAYTVKNVSHGIMKVEIHAPKVVGKRKLYQNDPKSAEIEISHESLPERYSNHDKSELILEVKERAVKKDFDLKK
jgi:hypothetical protein